MQNFKNIFDDFNIQARIIPALITVLPIYIYLLLKNLVINNFIESILMNSIVSVLLIALFYRIVRNFGKKYEKKMYKKLGAKPTTIVLRYSNSLIDETTKTRYHKKLNEKIDEIELPTNKEKETNNDDRNYETAINWLRKYANLNREKEIRVYQELKDYNFWRNLYGGKWIVIISCIISIFIECYELGQGNIIELIKNPFPKDNILFIMFGILIVSCIVINKKTVQNKAFDYAKTLLEVCDSL